MIAFNKEGLEPIQAAYETCAVDIFGHLRSLREPKRFVHYYYPLDDLAEEIYKRTSVIGKHRKDKESGESRLDEIALTQDEIETFDFLAQDAAHEVFEKIIAYTDDKIRSIFYNDGGNNTIIRKENNGHSIRISDVQVMSDTEAGNIRCSAKCVINEPLQENEQLVCLFSGEYDISNYMGETERRTFSHIVTNIYKPAVDKKTEYNIVFDYSPTIDNAPSSVPGVLPEVFIGNAETHMETCIVNYIVPQDIPINSWVEYYNADGTKKLYLSTTNSNMNSDIHDVRIYTDMTGNDLRRSIHYVVNKPIWVRENSIVRTDKSIWEALVAYIMFKWFAIVLPEEAENYLVEYERRIIDVKYNLAFSERMSVVSHPF